MRGLLAAQDKAIARAAAARASTPPKHQPAAAHAEHGDAAQAHQPHHPAEGEVAPGEMEDDLGVSHEELERAAVRIQAAFKGMHARKKVGGWVGGLPCTEPRRE